MANLSELGEQELLRLLSSLRLVVASTVARKLGQSLLEVVHLEILDDGLDHIGGVAGLGVC